MMWSACSLCSAASSASRMRSDTSLLIAWVRKTISQVLMTFMMGAFSGSSDTVSSLADVAKAKVEWSVRGWQSLARTDSRLRRIA